MKKRLKVSHILSVVIVVACAAFVGCAVGKNQEVDKVPAATTENPFPETAKELFSSGKAILTYEQHPDLFEGVNSGDKFKYDGYNYRCYGLREDRVAYRILNKSERETVLLYDDLADLSEYEAYCLSEMINLETEDSYLGYWCIERSFPHGTHISFYYTDEGVSVFIRRTSFYETGQAISYTKDQIESEGLAIPELGESINLFSASEEIKERYTDTLVRIVEDVGGMPWGVFDGSRSIEKGSEEYVTSILNGSWERKQEADARQERIAELEKEKQQVAEDAKLNPDKYASDDSNISFDEINEKRLEAIEDAKFWVKQYNSALSLVRFKNPAMGQPDIDSLEDVDVEILAALVDTLKKCPLSTAEEECLKSCLRENYLMVNETDPLYDEIMKILG